MAEPTLSEIMHVVAQIRSEVRELRRQIERGGLKQADIPDQRGAQRRADGKLFLPGTGLLEDSTGTQSDEGPFVPPPADLQERIAAARREAKEENARRHEEEVIA